MKYSNPHTHTVFCDGKNTPEEMLAAAERFGFASLGFSGHAPQPKDVANGFGIQNEDEYIAAVRALQSASKKVRVHQGLEVDLYAYCKREEYDYILGAVHYIYGGGEYHAVDHSAAQNRRCAVEVFGGDTVKMAKAYYDNVAAVIEMLKPDIVAHFDVMTKFIDCGSPIDMEHPEYRRIAKDVLKLAIENDALIEVNTGGMARGYRTTPYPDDFILRTCREMGGRVILGSDCHNADLLNYGFDAALEHIRAAGFKSIVRLGGFGESLFVEEAL